jgi:hypothetical protein
MNLLGKPGTCRKISKKIVYVMKQNKVSPLGAAVAAIPANDGGTQKWQHVPANVLVLLWQGECKARLLVNGV